MKQEIIRFIITVFWCLLSISGIAQSDSTYAPDQHEEVYFEFRITGTEELALLTSIISIDKVDGLLVTANANLDEWNEFIKLGYDYRIIPPPYEGFVPEMLEFDEVLQRNDWNYYPTYTAYESLMYQFQTDHPGKCSVINIGTLPSGRKLLGARINANPNPKPQFLYSATMHGDETTGYILMLRLIDYLLTEYGSNPKVTRLVDSVEIWIFPLTNPDGTYYGGNNTVAQARRRNANNVDLNRNYPDPRVGPHPDGNAWQPETIAFMELAQQQHFSIGANIHGGVEVCNYPWDTWSRLTADNTWWVNVTREYADTAQYYSPSGYMTYLNNGITNGYAWYSVAGGRQDYMNYYHHCREFTLEISNSKLLPAAQLPAFWGYNYRSFLNYMEQALYGIRGVVTDSITGQPVEAEIYISGHDLDQSQVFSIPPHGNYHRYLAAGTYSLSISAPCYQTTLISNISVSNRQTTWLNVQLLPLALPADTLIVNHGTLGQVLLEWQMPAGSTGVLLAYALSAEFGEPVSGTIYQQGDTLVGGGFVVYCGGTDEFIHEGLSGNTTYYYKIWTISAGSCYSAAVSSQITTNPFFFVNARVLLEGAFNDNQSPLLNNMLNPVLPLFQPYNTALPYFNNPLPVWHYSGVESILLMPPDIVDWVLVELRDANDPGNATQVTAVVRKAALLRNDGWIKDVNNGLLVFETEIQNNLFIVIYHRNHLGVMSSQPALLLDGVYSWDFTDSQQKAFNEGMKPLGNGFFGMFGGDGDGSGQIQNQDKNEVWIPQSGLSGYLPGDYDMNGQVQNQDKNNIWNPNSGMGSAIPH